jgi:hypothetical protein
MAGGTGLSRSVYCAHPFPERNLDLHQVQGRRARLVVSLLLLGRRFACLFDNVDNGVRLEITAGWLESMCAGMELRQRRNNGSVQQ